MNHTEFLTAIAEKTALSKKQVKEVLDAYAAILMDSLKKGDKVLHQGVGIYATGCRSAREGRHPQTGKPITIKASYVAKFKPSKLLKDTLADLTK